MTGSRHPRPLPVDPRTDSHVHTHLCNHASGTMEEYIRAAVARGLDTIIFLEHLEAGIDYGERTWLTRNDFNRYFSEGERLREKYRQKIKVRLGVEIGYNPSAVELLRTKLAAYPFEFRGLSYHFFHDGSHHFNMVSRRRSNIDALVACGADRVVTAYFAGLIEALQTFDVQVLCHLDAVLRHYPELSFTRSHRVQIDRLLQLLKKKGISLEVNTSGFGLRNEPYPARAILKRAMELGIVLTAGSDAHRPEQVARYFDRLPAYLSDLSACERLHR